MVGMNRDVVINNSTEHSGHALPQILQQPNKVGTNVTTILELGKLRLSEVNCLLKFTRLRVAKPGLK